MSERIEFEGGEKEFGGVSPNKPINQQWRFQDPKEITRVVDSHATEIEALQAIPPGGINEYDIYGTESEILALDVTANLGKVAWATDIKIEMHPISVGASVTGIATWIKNGLSYDAPTDSWSVPTDLSGQTLEVGYTDLVNVVNVELTSISATDPQVVMSQGSSVEGYSDIIRVNANDVGDGDRIMITTTGVGASGGLGKSVVRGHIHGIDASGGIENWIVNDTLYLHPSSRGVLTNIKPNLNARAVAKVHNNSATVGVIDVDINAAVKEEPNTSKLDISLIHLTADVFDVGGSDFYILNTLDQGVIASAEITATANDGETNPFNQGFITYPLPTDTTLVSELRKGSVEYDTDTTAVIHVEAYETDGNGTPIDSGIGSVGSLGVRPVLVYLSNSLTGSDIRQIEGVLVNDYIISAGNRFRLELLFEKSINVGGTKNASVFVGTDHETNLEAFSAVSTDGIVNDSVHTGEYLTEVLNESVQVGGQWGVDSIGGVHNIGLLFGEVGWLGTPLVATEEHLAPQGDGNLEPSMDDTDFTTANNTSVVKMVHKFTVTEDVNARELEIFTPFYDSDTVTKITLINITTGVAEVLTPILTSNEWTTLITAQTIVGIGVEYEVWFEIYNASAANAINGGWSSVLGTGTPTSQSFNIDNLSTPTVVEIDHTDLDSDNRSTELDGVVSGSIVRFTETADVARNIEFEVDTVDLASGTSTKYTVLTGSINNGSKNIRSGQTVTVHIDVPITQPTEYSVKTDYYPNGDPSWATIESRLYFDGVLQADSDDGYGIRITAEKVTFSTDWKRVLAPSSSGSVSVSGVQSVTGDGTSGTATEVIMTFPTPDEIGALKQGANTLTENISFNGNNLANLSFNIERVGGSLAGHAKATYDYNSLLIEVIRDSLGVRSFINADTSDFFIGQDYNGTSSTIFIFDSNGVSVFDTEHQKGLKVANGSDDNVDFATDDDNFLLIGKAKENLELKNWDQVLVNTTTLTITSVSGLHNSKTLSVFGAGALCEMTLTSTSLAIGGTLEVVVGDVNGFSFIPFDADVVLFGLNTGSTTVGDIMSIRRVPNGSYNNGTKVVYVIAG